MKKTTKTETKNIRLTESNALREVNFSPTFRKINSAVKHQLASALKTNVSIGFSSSLFNFSSIASSMEFFLLQVYTLSNFFARILNKT